MLFRSPLLLTLFLVWFSLSWVPFPEFFYQLLGTLYVGFWFPGVVARRVSLPLDQVVPFVAFPFLLHVYDLFDFIFFFTFNKVRWRLGKVWPM